MSTRSAARRRPAARGGRGGVEPRARIADREGRVWHLSVRGYTQREIGDAIGISQPAVCIILRRVADRHGRELQADAFRQQTRIYARLEHVYRLALEGWDRSAGDRTRRRQQRAEGAAAGDTRAPRISEITVENCPGDPRVLREAKDLVLALAQWARATLPAPTATAAPTLDLSRLSEDELAMFEALHAKAGPVAAPTARQNPSSGPAGSAGTS